MYCQHQLGIGHLVRSLNIVRNSLEDFKIIFIQGGTNIGLTIKDDNFVHYFLEPIQMTAYTQEFYSSNGLSIADVWNKRSNQIEEIINKHDIDVIITELFPFGRFRFYNEIVPMLEKIKLKNKSVKIIASIRDILVDPLSEKQRGVLVRFYDYVLAHTDERYVELSKVETQDVPVYNTGYVVNTNEKKSSKVRVNNQVLVSLGGGAVGEELILAVLEVSKELENFKFIIVTGVNYKGFDEIKKLSQKNITIKRFVSDLELLMRESALSISMGGYNTIMNLLNTETFGLVYAYDENSEQLIRAKSFEKVDVLKVLTRKCLHKSIFKEIIVRNINKPYSRIDINLNGSYNTNEFIKKIVNGN